MSQSTPDSPDDRDANPYASPKPVAPEPRTPTDLEAVQERRHYLIEELWVALVGAAYILLGMVTLGEIYFIGLAYVRISPIERIVASTIGIAISVSLCVVGIGLTRCRPWAKIPATILLVLCLANVPCGTIVGMWSMMVILSRDARHCLSPEYAAIIRRTPQISYRAGCGVWGLAIGGIVIVILFAIALW